MGFLGLSFGEPSESVKPEYKFSYINLDAFRTDAPWAICAYITLYIGIIIAIISYGLDLFVLFNLLYLDEWNPAIEPAIDPSISKWIFAGCIILSLILLVIDWIGGWRTIRSGSISGIYLHAVAVSWSCVFGGWGMKLQRGQRVDRMDTGYRRFLVFKELTEKRSKREYVVLATYFAFKGWIRTILAEGPRQVINALSLYSVFRAKLLPGEVARGKEMEGLKLFFHNFKALFDRDQRQALLIAAMALSILIWIFSLLKLLFAALSYVCYVWHVMSRVEGEEGTLHGYCKSRIEKRMRELVQERSKNPPKLPEPIVETKTKRHSAIKEKKKLQRNDTTSSNTTLVSAAAPLGSSSTITLNSEEPIPPPPPMPTQDLKRAATFNSISSGTTAVSNGTFVSQGLHRQGTMQSTVGSEFGGSQASSSTFTRKIPVRNGELGVAAGAAAGGVMGAAMTNNNNNNNMPPYARDQNPPPRAPGPEGLQRTGTDVSMISNPQNIPRSQSAFDQQSRAFSPPVRSNAGFDPRRGPPNNNGLIGPPLPLNGQLPASRGPRGPQGPQGFQGPQGPQNPQVPQGQRMVMGPNGPIPNTYNNLMQGQPQGSMQGQGQRQGQPMVMTPNGPMPNPYYRDPQAQPQGRKGSASSQGSQGRGYGYPPQQQQQDGYGGLDGFDFGPDVEAGRYNANRGPSPPRQDPYGQQQGGYGRSLQRSNTDQVYYNQQQQQGQYPQRSATAFDPSRRGPQEYRQEPHQRQGSFDSQGYSNDPRQNQQHHQRQGSKDSQAYQHQRQGSVDAPYGVSGTELTPLPRPNITPIPYGVARPRVVPPVGYKPLSRSNTGNSTATPLSTTATVPPQPTPVPEEDEQSDYDFEPKTIAQRGRSLTAPVASTQVLSTANDTKENAKERKLSLSAIEEKPASTGSIFDFTFEFENTLATPVSPIVASPSSFLPKSEEKKDEQTVNQETGYDDFLFSDDEKEGKQQGLRVEGKSGRGDSTVLGWGMGPGGSGGRRL